jgi:hypothetical protein
VTNIEPGQGEPAPREVGKLAIVVIAEIGTERPFARAYVRELLPQIEALIRGDGPYLQ